MNRVRLFIILLISAVLFSSGEEKDILAILGLECKGVIAKDVSTIMAEINRQFSKDTALIVLEEEIIDMMLKEQGFDRSATCSNIQCYTGVGHLLTVSKVIGGTVTIGTDRMISVSLDLADVAKSELVCHETAKAYSIAVLTKNEIPKLTTVMLAKFHQWKNNQFVQSDNVSQTPVPQKKKRPLLRSLSWLSTGALIAGGAVGVYYKFLRPSHDESTSQTPGGSTAVTDVPTGDVPVHTR